MTTLCLNDLHSSEHVLPFKKPAKRILQDELNVIRQALEVTCKRLKLSALQTQAVLDTAYACRSVLGTSVAASIADGARMAERIAKTAAIRHEANPRRFPGPDAAA